MKNKCRTQYRRAAPAFQWETSYFKNLKTQEFRFKIWNFFGWILIFIFIFFSVCLLCHRIQRIRKKWTPKIKNKYSEPNAGPQRLLFNERFQISKILKYKNLDSKSEFFVSLFYIRKKYESNNFLKFTYVHDIHFNLKAQ